jgi:hypothetical protein
LRDAGCFEHLRAVAARGNDGGSHVLCAKRFDEAHGRLVALHAVGFERFHEVLVLALGEPLHGELVARVIARAEWKLDAARGEKGRDAVQARLAVYVAPVVGCDIERHERFACSRRTLREQLVEKLLPRRRVHARSVREDTIEIEQDRVEIPRRECDDGGMTGHDGKFLVRAGA